MPKAPTPQLVAKRGNLGTSLKLPDGQVRVLDHSFDPTKIQNATDYKVLSEVPGVCAWVGKTSTSEKHEGWVVDSFPIFYAEGLSDEMIGAMLFVDLARDLSAQQRVRPSWVVPQLGQLGAYCRANCDPQVTSYIHQVLVGKKLGVKTAAFILARVARVLRANYPKLASALVVDGRRLVLSQGAVTKRLVQLSDTTTYPHVDAFATSMGATYLSVVESVAKHAPELLERDFFTVTEEP